MGIVKTLLILVIFYYLGKALFRMLIGALHKARHVPVAEKEQLVIGEMLACSHCGVYAAKTGMIESGGRLYCSPACEGRRTV